MKIKTLRWTVMSKRTRGFRHCFRDTKGVAMVEFAIIVTVLLLIVAGIMDLGHAFYMQQVVTNASREGARFGIVYRTNDKNVQLPPRTKDEVEAYLDNNFKLNTLLPSANVTVSPTDTTKLSCGDPYSVTVTATKTWWILDNFIPGLGDSKTLSHTTVMRCE
jgi:Flp pilus assembly protein TadG